MPDTAPTSGPTVITLGCRLNTYESELMRRHALEAGLSDAVIINTCAVTGEAVRGARQAIRRAAKENPGAPILVTGCAAQTDPEMFAAMPEVTRVIGNHEKNAHWYYDYFDLPKPEYYYTFTCGNAQFFMIDSNKDCGPGSEQYRWLEKALSESKATWKFTAHHHPCFSSDEDDYGDHLKGKPDEPFDWGDTNVRRLVPLYEKYGVDIAFAGHIHSYERTWPILQMTINQQKGVRYIVSGGGGGGLESAAPQRSWFSIHVQRGHHYGFAAVYDRTIQFKAYDVDGRLFDTFELTKPADR